MYRNILAAADGSDSGRNAFRQACRLARESGSWLTALTVVPPFEDVFDPRNVRNDIKKSLEQEGRRILSDMEAAAREEGVVIKTILEEGAPAERILAALEQGGYGLTVMGRHGKSSLETALMGSTAARVIAGSGRDVLVVPAGAQVRLEKILAATDGSKYGEAAVKRAFDLARAGGGEIAVVSVVDVNEEFQASAPGKAEDLVRKARAVVDAVMQRAAELGLNASSFVKEGEAYRAITGLAAELHSSVIIMGSHGRTGLKKFLMGSVTENVIGRASCPVLVVKP